MATLSSMASRGILGSDAGTSLKTFLSSLVPMSEKAAKAMETIGLEAYDAQGNFVGLETVAGQLRSGLSRLSDEEKNEALQTIFGSDAKRAAIVLMEEGEQGVRDWTAAVNDSGYAAEYAATLTDNLKGDIERLTGALDTLFVTTADGSNGPLRDLVQGLTAVADAANKPNEGILGFLNRPVIPVPNKQGGYDSLFGSFGNDDRPTADPGALAATRYADAMDATSAKAAAAARGIDKVSSSMLESAAAADEAAAAQTAANKAYLASIDVALRMSDAQINYEAALDDVTETIRENGKTLDIDTEKGRANMSALNDLKSASAGLVAQMIEQGDEQEDVAAAADEMADAIYKAAIKAGMGEEEAKAYADALRDVPKDVDTEYKAKGAKAAEEAAKDVADAIDDIPSTVTTTWRFKTAAAQGAYNKVRNLDPTLHDGGVVPGAGDVPITAQGGEYVINRSQYAANADLVRAINNGSGAVSASGMRIDVGGITVNESRTAHQNVIDALAESAYRQGMVR